MEFNHESYGTKLERHFTSRIVINNQKIKRSLGNLSAMNHEFESSKWVIVVFFVFFGAKSRHLRHGARFGVVVMLESVPWMKIHGVNSAMEFLSAENHSPLSIHSSHKGTCFFW